MFAFSKDVKLLFFLLSFALVAALAVQLLLSYIPATWRLLNYPQPDSGTMMGIIVLAAFGVIIGLVSLWAESWWWYAFLAMPMMFALVIIVSLIGFQIDSMWSNSGPATMVGIFPILTTGASLAFFGVLRLVLKLFQ